MMNPDTNRFEEIPGDDEHLLKAYLKGWKVFAIGEKVTIKETDFTVVDISPNKLVLRPYGNVNLSAKQEAQKAHA
jgi:hypothetical protein